MRDGGRLYQRRRLPSPYRAEHMGERGRFAAPARHDGTVPCCYSLSVASRPCRRAPQVGRDGHLPRWRERSRRECGALSARPGCEWYRTRLGQAKGTVARYCGGRTGDVLTPPGYSCAPARGFRTGRAGHRFRGTAQRPVIRCMFSPHAMVSTEDQPPLKIVCVIRLSVPVTNWF